MTIESTTSTMGASAPLTCRTDREDTHEYLLDGRPVPSVTDRLKHGVAKPSLTSWAAREVATFAADNLELLEQLRRDEVIDLLKGAPYRDRDHAANRGSEVHRLAQAIVEGREVQVSEEIRGHVDAYLTFRKAWQPREEICERSVFSRRRPYAGTFDLWARLRQLGATLLDVKTNRSGPFGETALQLVAYSHADFMLTDAGEVPIPEIESYAVLWLRQDGYDLYRYDVTEREWEAFLHACGMAAWLEERSRHVKGYPLRPPASGEGGGR